MERPGAAGAGDGGDFGRAASGADDGGAAAERAATAGCAAGFHAGWRVSSPDSDTADVQVAGGCGPLLRPAVGTAGKPAGRAGHRRNECRANERAAVDRAI